MSEKHEKVLVAVSGGVDSSVSAALLKEAGYEVEGAFIRTWTAPWLPCTWKDERRDAMRVAAQLHIPFHDVDLSELYEREVVDYLVSEYKAGRTPNPDVMCNKAVKFGGFFDWAMEHGFDRIATGHYAQVKTDKQGVVHMHAGKDAGKDQTYFLWTLGQEQLARTLFPVGAMEKRDVRKEAARIGLHTATKKDSQGVCFLGKLDMKEFLSHYIEPVPGDVLDENGKVIGSHDGAMYFTLGQRHGFTIHHTTPDARPRYVTAKDIQANTITTSEEPLSEQMDGLSITIKQCNWISDAPSEGVRLQARLRYRQKLFAVSVASLDTEQTILTLEEQQPFVPEGQSVVLYDGDECLGGGVIG